MTEQVRLGFAILCHDNPFQLARLIDALRHDARPIVVHVVQASLDALALAFRLDPDLTHVALLSGTHMPVRPIDEVAASLQCRQTVIEMHGQPLDQAQLNSWTGTLRDRLAYRYEEVPGIGPVCVEARPEARAIPFAVGSQWLILARDHFSALTSGDVADQIAIFRTSLIPDEMFFQSLLSKLVPAPELRNRQCTLVNFKSDGRPDALDETSVEKAAEQGYAFARKFADGTALSEAFRHRLRRHDDGPLEAHVMRMTGTDLEGGGPADAREGLNRAQGPAFLQKTTIAPEALLSELPRQIGTIVTDVDTSLMVRAWGRSIPATLAIHEKNWERHGCCLVFRTADFANFDAALCTGATHQEQVLALLGQPDHQTRLSRAFGSGYELARGKPQIVSLWPWLDLFHGDLRQEGIRLLNPKSWREDLRSYVELWARRYLAVCACIP
jgi:hypothetical protein